MFSNRQRVARMRRLAVRALDAYPLADRELRFVADEENTTFRVDATAPDGRDRFLLRVHRPARHGRDVDSEAAIGSELDWLMALPALTDGYTRYRPLPPGGLAHLDDFIATREVAIGLWFTGTAQVNPVFRAELDQVQADTGRSPPTSPGVSAATPTRGGTS